MNFNAVASIKLQSHVISPKRLLQSEISKSNVKIQEDCGTTIFPLCQNSTINSKPTYWNKYQEEIMSLLKMLSLVSQASIF